MTETSSQGRADCEPHGLFSFLDLFLPEDWPWIPDYDLVR